MDNKRLFDLVRLMRMELHEEGLITDEEYADLLNDDRSKESIKRLESYDEMKAGRNEQMVRAERAEERVVELDKSLNNTWRLVDGLKVQLDKVKQCVKEAEARWVMMGPGFVVKKLCEVKNILFDEEEEDE